MEIRFFLENINEAATQFLKAMKGRRVVALHGEMGAGKTTLVHALCDALGVKDAVGSPTFSIINEYTSAEGETIYHLDLYRLKNDTEAVNAGVEDCLYSGNLCFTEWPDRAPAVFPDDTLYCELKITGNNERSLQIKL